MKKILILIYCFPFIFASCKNEVVKNDLELENLKGKVKSIITSSGEGDELILESMFKYNPDGYLIYQEEYSNYDESPQINTEILRDKSNNRTEDIINNKFNYDSSLNHKTTKKYNYNKNNELIEIIEFDSEKKIFSNKEIKYDDKGNVISENLTNIYAPDYHTYKYKYDGDVLLEKQDKNMITKATYIHIYGDNQEISTIYKDDKNKVTSSKKYLYDDNGNINEELNMNEKGALSSSLRYSYDEKNNLIEIKQTDKGKLSSIIKYDYDDIGNWIKETTSYTGAETIIKTRKIEYYSDNEKVDSVTNITKTDEIIQPEKPEEKIDINDNLKSLNEIELTLIDATLKKAKIYLGEPDVYEPYFGHITKGFIVYFDKVSNNGTPKHLVLFLRNDIKSTSNNPKIEEIYSIEDNQKACFGIHCIMIKNQEIYTNALDLIYDRGYKSL